jgi:hypothetical protein
MEAQTEIVTQVVKWDAIKQLSAYGVAALFGIIAGLIVAFSPPSNQLASDIVASAFVILAAGVAGYTYVRTKAHKIEITAGQGPTPARKNPSAK